MLPITKKYFLLHIITDSYIQFHSLFREEPPVTIKVSVRPRDPDFPFDLEHLMLLIVLSEGYPHTQNLQIEVLNEDIPEKIKQFVPFFSCFFY